MANMISMPAMPFPLATVRLLSGPFKDAREADENFMLQTDGNRLLAPYREVAGLPATHRRYGGWEDLDKRDRIEVRFQAHPGKMAGRVFNVCLLRK